MDYFGKANDSKNIKTDLAEKYLLHMAALANDGVFATFLCTSPKSLQFQWLV